MAYRTYGLAVALTLSLLASAQAANHEVQLHRVKYAQLVETVKQQRGRVVVIDFWASFCLPCKKAFPKLIQMHQKYAAQGLTIISVSLDDPTDPDAEVAARDFLQSVQSPFLNVLLDEKPEEWRDKLPVNSLPSVYVFNRDGQIEKRWLDGPDYAAIEKLVIQLLEKK